MMTISVGRSEHLCVDSTLMCTNKILLRDSPKTKCDSFSWRICWFLNVKHDVPFTQAALLVLLYFTPVFDQS
jgi:hypothetical protein